MGSLTERPMRDKAIPINPPWGEARAPAAEFGVEVREKRLLTTETSTNKQQNPIFKWENDSAISACTYVFVHYHTWCSNVKKWPLLHDTWYLLFSSPPPPVNLSEPPSPRAADTLLSQFITGCNTKDWCWQGVMRPEKQHLYREQQREALRKAAPRCAF